VLNGLAFVAAPCHHGGMNPSPPSVQRIAPGPFVSAAIGIYVLSFASQVLLAAPVASRLSVAPFALAQALLIASWIVLHRRRLHDAGRPTGIVSAIAILYALEVMLLIAVVTWMLSATAGASGGVGPGADILQLFVILYLLTLLSGDPSLGALQLWIFGFVAVMALPVVIALSFSVWAALRPSVPPAP
jgi:uncharacterized membrane protein YhaH (DUF805 family)